ncbi:MAG: sigma-70 family RNA polymerase sigma factor [Thermodesulfobacteriota bacterium]
MLNLKFHLDLSDEDAMRMYQDGDGRAFEILLDRHGAPVLRYVMKMLHIEQCSAEDLMQEVFLKVIERRGSYDPDKKFTTWLYTITRNHCIDYMRVHKNRRHELFEAPVYGREGAGPVFFDVVESEERDQEQKAMDSEIREIMDRGMEDMSDEIREVFLLREIEDMALKEIADIVDAPLSTVKSRLRYAYKKLREVFIRVGYFEEEKRA